MGVWKRNDRIKNQDEQKKQNDQQKLSLVKPITQKCQEQHLQRNGVESLISDYATGTKEITTSCPFAGVKKSPYSVRDLLKGTETTDTLHFKANKNHCSESRCLGSVYMPKNEDKRYAGEMRSKEEIKKQAFEFLNEYYAAIKQKDSEAHHLRLKVVENEIDKIGTYHILEEELSFGAKLAWRNAPRCIGRIQWKKLKVFDCRHVKTAKQMFECILEHIRYATNGGNLRSTMTIFPPRSEGKEDFRIYNSQLIKYAGYKQSDGTVIGDAGSIEITEIAMSLGWQGRGTPFDVLPMILQASGGAPEYFEYSEKDILEVDIKHPQFKALNKLNLKWYAIPAVANMLFDCGGLEFTAAPFNGWYMATEIGARDFTDPTRYNMMKPIAEAFGFNTSNNSTLWKDKVMVELTVAVLHSYNEAGVTITDHHTASETFMKHLKDESKIRGGCPADWVWIVPPISGSATPVFHQEMLLYHLRPSYEYQPDPWNDFRIEKKDLKTLKQKMKAAFWAVTFASGIMKKLLKKRQALTILYATETGKSETFAKALNQLFSQVFDSKVECMIGYDFTRLMNEQFVIVVSSTFGNGDAPDNGKDFGKSLYKLMQQSSMIEMCSNGLAISQRPKVIKKHSIIKVLSNLTYSVFALGSRAYPNFCEFGHTVDNILKKLGGHEVYPIEEGDELNGQEDSFKTWARACFKAASQKFGIEINESHLAVLGVVSSKPWKAGKYRLIKSEKQKSETIQGLSQIHKRKIYTNEAISVKNLQSNQSGQITDLIRLKTCHDEAMKYEPGDHLCVYPANNSQMVEELLARCECSVSNEETVEIQCNKGENSDLWVPLERLPMPTTLKDIITSYLDITSPPSVSLLSLFMECCSSENDRNDLMNLINSSEAYAEWKDRYNPTILETLEQFPSISCDVTMLLKELPLLKARYYSISSSVDLYPNEVHATVALVRYSIEGKDRDGVCSSYLNRLKPGDVVPCVIRKAPLFHLPPKNEPVMMIGAGSGIAPFRSFWQQRLCDKIQDNKDSADIFMFFGCRNPEHDDIYAKELQEAKQMGALTNVFTAYSRHPTQPKKYVQHLLRENKSLVSNHIITKNGHIYVCGDVNMAADVEKTLKEILEEEMKTSKEDGDAYMKELRNKGRYHEDIFGATHSNSKTESTTLNKKKYVVRGNGA